MDKYDVIVIGQGYAGLVAAGLCAKAGLCTASFEQENFGGLALNINHLDPSPARAVASGVELVSELATENMELGVVGVAAQVTGIRREANGLFVVSSSDGDHAAPHVVVAAGARLRKLGVPGEEALHGRGVSYCADCDGPMFQGKEVVVVGGGDSAFQEALALTDYCSRITLVYRGEVPRARADLVQQVAADARIEQLPRHVPTALVGSDGVSGVRLQDAAGGMCEIACSGVFVFVGLEPNSECVPPEVEKSDSGLIRTSAQCETSLPGLWAIGAVREGYGGMLSDAHPDAEAAVHAIQGRGKVAQAAHT